MPHDFGCSRILNLDSSSFQVRLDIIDVLADIRPVARIIVHRGMEATNCARALLSESLDVSVGSACELTPGPLGFTDDRRSVSEADRAEFIRLYVSKRRCLADTAKAADDAANDSALGTALGYPDCCVAAVGAWGSVPRILESLTLYSEDGYYDPFAWPAAHLYDAGLVPHFPCSMRCAETHRIAKARLAILRTADNTQRTQFWRRFVGFNTMQYAKEAEAYPRPPWSDLGSFTPLLPVMRQELFA